MTIWDDRILEYVREYDGAAVGEMADSDIIRVSQPHVSRRCKKLADHGLLRPLGNGVYVITERGERYLDGEIDVSEDMPDEPPSASEENNGPATGEQMDGG